MAQTKRIGLVVAGVVIAAALVAGLSLTKRGEPGPVARDANAVAADAAAAAAAAPYPPATLVTASELPALAAAPHVLFRHTGIDKQYNYLSVAPLAEPDARRGTTPLECERISFAGGHGICLQADRGVLTTFSATLFDDAFKARSTFKLEGSPTRTRISPDGRVGALTVFLTGQQHGYSSTSFSTKTSFIDMASGDVLGDLEQFNAWRDGQRFTAKDFNFWGVTFARNSNEFYATLKTNKKTYLVRGDLALRRLTVLHENVECPSLSPDNRLIAYKKRVGGDLAPWRFYILDVGTMAERPLAAETRSIDDQIEWLDDGHVMYGARRNSQSAISDVWVAAVDGPDPARVFLHESESPIVVR